MQADAGQRRRPVGVRPSRTPPTPGYLTTSQSASSAQRQRALLWRDELGAGVQIALFDAVAKNENVPICDLLGSRVRNGCPISWWTCDMGPEDWARQCEMAVARGYMSAKLKTRPWQDLHACLQRCCA